ncbi:Erythronate-4-phosphate dehydrogenase family protein [Quillaja saponaria]|uniref:Erythronate-4-phosphate dehydrogenase family protein n=1 Tax=Quillaja saponaria TaxID=32244 RepID=A0AAD7KM14_QUISA|nr:Erythronate-4-phosphate dehydrogenase family protein [Quillaja saponaria]KAJ7942321.1 Erythronate-4-phosphate dehydrogenase family protein [Quillaja saponaria]KAJ7967327.1 Erythronate-4-phosphate dehydrogenase family protein [Quillaja saponaria]
MENSYKTSNGNGPTDNDHMVTRLSPYQHCMKASLQWLDLRVFYVRFSKCDIDDSMSEYLTLNHIPLNPDTLLEINGVRTSIYSDGVSALLRRDRLDKKSEEATFVSTDSIRMTGSVKFEVFDKDVLLLSGVLELCNNNGVVGDSKANGQRWNMNCPSDIIAGTSFFKGKQLMGPDSTSPTIEVYIAGSFSGTPIILTKTLQLSSRKKHTRQGMLDSIPEYEANENHKDILSPSALQEPEYLNHKPEDEDYNNLYSGTEYLEGEDGELSWFNAGVRVGVGIGLSVCLGIGIGVGLLVRTYQGTTRNFRRRLL